MKIEKPRYLALFLLIGALASMSVMPAHGQNRREERRARQLASEGDKNFRSKNYRTAVENYAQAIALFPKFGHARFFKGASHWYLNEPDMALPEFDAALANGYDRPLDVYRTRWRIHFANKNYDLALADVQSGLKLAPESPDLTLALGDIHFGKGEYAQAIDRYTAFNGTNPTNAEVHLNIAKSHAALGHYEQQISAAEEALRRGTTSVAEAQLLIGDGYTLQLKYPEAELAYKKAVAAMPNAYEPYRRLAEAYRAQALFDSAILESRKALRLFPTDGAIYTDISWYYSLADRHEEAVDAAQAGIRFQPESHMAYTNLCRAYNDLKRYELAVAACNNALRIKPNDGESLFYIARANRALGKTAEASRQIKNAVIGLEQTVRENPTYSDAHYLLGGAYYDDGQTSKALTSYLKTLELSPNFVRALYNVGIIYLIDGKKDLALVQYQKLKPISEKYAGMLKDEIDKS